MFKHTPVIHWTDKYRSVPYVDCGRDVKGLDCWGLVRLVLHEEYNLPLFESFGHVHPDNKHEMTTALQTQLKTFTLTNPKETSVASGFCGNKLIHVGVCILADGELKVLEISRKHGVSVSALRDFKRKYLTTKFYTYQSEPTS